MSEPLTDEELVGMDWRCRHGVGPVVINARDGQRFVAEIRRLKRGEFTPEEFQALCHHRDERPGCTRADFEAGCREYTAKLFGGAAP
jgi:hypothetical protein